MEPGEAKFIQRWNEDPGWRGRIGFITPPNFDIVPMEFLKIAPYGFASNEMKTYQVKDNAPAKFTWNVPGINSAIGQVEHCAEILKLVGCDLIGQIGTPFAFCPDGGYKFSSETEASLEKKLAIPVVYMGMSVVRALRYIGAKSIAVACQYYGQDWKDRYLLFLKDAGFDVVDIQSWVSLGMYPSDEEVRRTMIRRFHMSLVYRNAKEVAKAHPEADAIVISGGGIFTMDIINELEFDLRKPVITSSGAFFWDIFRRMGAYEPLPGRGSLLESLAMGPGPHKFVFSKK